MPNPIILCVLCVNEDFAPLRLCCESTSRLALSYARCCGRSVRCVTLGGWRHVGAYVGILLARHFGHGRGWTRENRLRQVTRARVDPAPTRQACVCLGADDALAPGAIVLPVVALLGHPEVVAHLVQ